jgi:hypothetical protein
MALYNGVTGADIKQSASAIANEVERSMLRWKYFAEKLNTMSEADLTALSVSTEYQTYLSSLRVALLNIELKYRNQAPLDSSDSSYIVKLFSQLNVI